MAKQIEDRVTREIPSLSRQIRSAYSPRMRVLTDVSGESMTKQSFKDECDINVIMKRYEKSGVIPFLDQREPRYMDCTAFDFQEAQFLVRGAMSMFEELPASLRDRFDNDPAKLLEFLGDDRNRKEAEELGLVTPKPPEDAPLKVEVTNAPAAVVEPPAAILKAPKKGAD